MALTTEGWRNAYRIVSSRFPPVGLFDDVASPEDLEAIYWLEGMTNPRLRQELGSISMVVQEDRIAGPGTTPIMAAFTHINPNGSRFSDGTYGVYYAGRDEETAIAETVFHTERWAAESHDPPVSFVMRLYIGELKELRYHDIRGRRRDNPEWYAEDYTQAQALGGELRGQGSWGLLYDSVRKAGGECAAVFRPNALGAVRQGKHFAYLWDGLSVRDVLEIRG